MNHRSLRFHSIELGHPAVQLAELFARAGMARIEVEHGLQLVDGGSEPVLEDVDPRQVEEGHSEYTTRRSRFPRRSDLTPACGIFSNACCLRPASFCSSPRSWSAVRRRARVTRASVSPTPPRARPDRSRPPSTGHRECGPFPALALFHGCHGVSASNHGWARWLRDRGYVAFVVDSWAAAASPMAVPPSSPTCPTPSASTTPWARCAFSRGSRAWTADARGGHGMVERRRVRHGRRQRPQSRARGPARRGDSAARLSGVGRALSGRLRLADPGIRGQAAPAPHRGGRRLDAGEHVPRDDREHAGARRPRGDRAVRRRAYHYFDVEGQAKTFLPDVGNENRPGGAGATVAFDAAANADAHRRVEQFLARYLGTR